ncbi:hypothetical protein ACIOZL_19725 [Streptomyces sp. NPDC087769]|uniref:hypothetical protein n=1 Tax=Streptomyces sp. NPDC087769 TaxID=3365802 RepID=UPI003822F195
MSAADHLREAIDFGCTRDDHDHVAMHRAEVLAEAADPLAEIGTPIHGTRSEHERGLMYGAERLRRMADDGASVAQLARFEDARNTLQETRQGGAL